MNLYSFSALCFAFCSFFVGILVWLKRPDQVGKLFFWHAICISFWGLGFALMINPAVPYDVALWAIRPANGIAAFIPTAWFHFVLALTDRLSYRKKILKWLYFLAGTVFLISFTPWFIPRLRPILDFPLFTTAGPLYSLLTLIYFLTVPFGFYELIQKIKITVSEEKKQLISLLIISLLGYIGGSLSFIPVYDIPFPQYGIFLLPVYPFGLAYVVTRTNLFDVKDLAEAAHRDKLRAVGVLAASINHEVKNPLFIIKTLAESCLERQKEGIFPTQEKIIESSNEAMRKSIEQADRAMDIIKRLSLFAKAGIDSEIKFESVKLSEVLDNILPLVRFELAAHSIALEREIPPNLPDVYVDRRYLEEILFNLIVNAIQAITASGKAGEIKVTAELCHSRPPQGVGRIRRRCLAEMLESGIHGSPLKDCGDDKKRQIATPGMQACDDKTNKEVIARETSATMRWADPSSGGKQSPDIHARKEEIATPGMRSRDDKVVVTIQDNGPGIPEDKIKDVFRPFYTTKQEGTGLGLYITQQLVEKIRGRIRVESPPRDGPVQSGVAGKLGQGTTFSVSLPVCVAGL